MLIAASILCVTSTGCLSEARAKIITDTTASLAGTIAAIESQPLSDIAAQNVLTINTMLKDAGHEAQVTPEMLAIVEAKVRENAGAYLAQIKEQHEKDLAAAQQWSWLLAIGGIAATAASAFAASTKKDVLIQMIVRGVDYALTKMAPETVAAFKEAANEITGAGVDRAVKEARVQANKKWGMGTPEVATNTPARPGASGSEIPADTLPAPARRTRSVRSRVS